jgi:Na+/alanine symporter
MTFIGAMLHVEFAWVMMDILITLVAIPNLIGITVLAFRQPNEIEL